jgi:hypothetical protein
MDQELLYTVKNVFDDLLAGGKKYVIPEYQRGYKWNKNQIEQLLRDIKQFKTEDEERYYCIQNITLVSNNKGEFTVVDGQQRLTTLIILLAYLGEEELIRGKLEYKVRETSNLFLQDYIIGRKIELEVNWDEFLKKHEQGTDFDHQDIKYMWDAYNTIRNWFLKNKTEITDKLLNRVKLIVNQLQSGAEKTLFSNLNRGQVHLDGADLIRAMLITRLPIHRIAGEQEVHYHLRVNEMRIKMGMELDRMSAWWNERKDYYKYLTCKVKEDAQQGVRFNDEAYPINHLYKLFILSQNEDSKKYVISIQQIEEASYKIDEFNRKLMRLQRTMEDWFSDDDLYHLVFYVIKHCNIQFDELYKLWNEPNMTRPSFIMCLKESIRKDFYHFEDLQWDDPQSSEANWFDHSQELIKVLILTDIIDALEIKRKVGTVMRLPVKALVKNPEDEREHISPQNPKDKVDEKRPAYIDMLGNLCLLDKSINAAYGNQDFKYKHIVLMQKSKESGIYIRPHVMDAFCKTFLKKGASAQFESWGEEDIKQRGKYLIERINVFINPA